MKKSIKNFLMRASVVLLAILLLVVQVNQANPLTAGFDRGEILTDETFTDVGGQYDVFHLLENVSVFSFGDTSGSHIVGPVLSKGMVSKINLDKKTVVDSIPETDLKQLLSLSTEKITVSDLNKGYPSYLGRISNAVGFEGNMRQFISEPNKIVDKINDYGELNDIFYKEGSEYQDGNIIHIKKTKGNGKDDPYKTEIKTLSGYVAIGGPGFVNPDFIDWETAFNEINAQSIQLLNNAKRIITTNDIVNHDGEMYLYVTPGEEVLVPKEIKFDTLGLVVGQENKKKGVFYNLERTIVSYEDSGRTYVKRVVLASDKNDKGSGFGQHAHQIHVPEHGG